jgi:hypothetical protein
MVIQTFQIELQTYGHAGGNVHQAAPHRTVQPPPDPLTANRLSAERGELPCEPDGVVVGHQETDALEDAQLPLG